MNTAQIKLGNIWPPDRVNTGTVEDIFSVLKACRDNKSFANDSSLIFAYFSDNGMLSRLWDLSNEQKSDLDQFISWLEQYTRQEDVYYKTRFKELRQTDDSSFKTFLLDLQKTYKKAYHKKETWNDNDIKTLRRQFLKGIRDAAVREKLLGMPENLLTMAVKAIFRISFSFYLIFSISTLCNLSGAPISNNNKKSFFWG